MHFSQLAEDRGFILLAPDGTDTGGTTFWAATDACCNFVNSPVDDSGYLRALIEGTQAAWPVDPKRIYVSGHSNGGFMSYRMGCDHSDLIAGIASLAGAAFDHAPTTLPTVGAYSCDPSSPLHVLQVHGNSDGTVSYNGGNFGHAYPGAVGSVNRWAAFNGCDAQSAPTPPVVPAVSWDLATPVGDDTSSARHGNCPAGGSAELWTISGGPHVPHLCAEEGVAGVAVSAAGGCTSSVPADGWPRLSARMVDWLLERRKP